MTVHDSQSDDQRPGESARKPASAARKRSNKSTTIGGAALAVLVAIYAVAQPVLNEGFGWQLPGLQQFAQNDEPAVAEKIETKPELTTPKTTPLEAEKPQKEVDSKPKTGSGPLANVRSKESASSARPTAQPTATSAPPAEDSLLFGILADQGSDRFLSPAGLMYVPGSQEGHRLKHVERHTVDDPGRPGSHGVFDGGMATALATIDKAYRKAKTGSQTSKQEEDGRTIYTVDMGSRVGYVGGSDGKRRKNPMARRVRLVLERNRVITAYPM
jgi:hypothetical protein